MYITLKYPLLFVNGYVAPDKVSFWGRIPQKLADRGIPVFYGNTAAWGDYESNALLLKETIDKILSNTKKEKINIIAHSKGGLDSRYLIWKYNFGDKIASLTTICTPHHGLETADLVINANGYSTKSSVKALHLFGKLCNEIPLNFHKVVIDLTTTKMKEFNEKVIIDNKVYCQSLYTTMRNRMNDMMFYHTYLNINKITGANDGLVSVYSTLWGSNHIKIAHGISHREILDFRKRKIYGKDIPAIYVGIVKDLGEKGF